MLVEAALELGVALDFFVKGGSRVVADAVGEDEGIGSVFDGIGAPAGEIGAEVLRGLVEVIVG